MFWIITGCLLVGAWIFSIAERCDDWLNSRSWYIDYCRRQDDYADGITQCKAAEAAQRKHELWLKLHQLPQSQSQAKNPSSPE